MLMFQGVELAIHDCCSVEDWQGVAKRQKSQLSTQAENYARQAPDSRESYRVNTNHPDQTQIRLSKTKS